MSLRSMLQIKKTRKNFAREMAETERDSTFVCIVGRSNFNNNNNVSPI